MKFKTLRATKSLIEVLLPCFGKQLKAMVIDVKIARSLATKMVVTSQVSQKAYIHSSDKHRY